MEKPDDRHLYPSMRNVEHAIRDGFSHDEHVVFRWSSDEPADETDAGIVCLAVTARGAQYVARFARELLDAAHAGVHGGNLGEMVKHCIQTLRAQGMH